MALTRPTAPGNAVAELRDDLLAVADRAIDIVADECFAPVLDNRDAVARRRCRAAARCRRRIGDHADPHIRPLAE